MSRIRPVKVRGVPPAPPPRSFATGSVSPLGRPWESALFMGGCSEPEQKSPACCGGPCRAAAASWGPRNPATYLLIRLGFRAPPFLASASALARLATAFDSCSGSQSTGRKQRGLGRNNAGARHPFLELEVVPHRPDLSALEPQGRSAGEGQGRFAPDPRAVP